MSQWNSDQGAGERALNRLQKRGSADSRLGDALRESGITRDDAESVRRAYDWSGTPGLRIVAAMRAIEAWLTESQGASSGK